MVKKLKLPIRWDKFAKQSLDDIYMFIAKDSLAAARRVKMELVKLAHSLNDFPKNFSIEEYLADEEENFRSVSKWSYKIIYEVTEDCIIIIDVFHTSQRPSQIKAHVTK